MADYLIQITYSLSAWQVLVKKPEDRTAAVTKAVEKLGGKALGFWLSFGDHDVIGILEMPDNVSMAAFSMALAAGGACRSVKTTPLMKLEDAMEAMKRAGNSGYKPVGKKK